MITEHKLKGLSIGNRGTFYNKNEDCFWADFQIDNFQELFQWAKSDNNFWKQEIICKIEHDKIAQDRTPINGKIISLEIW